MRINVLDLSRFCCASWDASERAGTGLLRLSLPLSDPSPSRAAPLFTHPFSLLDAPLRELRHTVQRNTPTPGIFFPLACSQRIFLSKSFPPLPSPPPPLLLLLRLPALLFPCFFRTRRSWKVRFRPAWKALSTSLLQGKNDAWCFVARTLERGSFGRRALKIFTPWIVVLRRNEDHPSAEEGLYRGCRVDMNFKNTEFLNVSCFRLIFFSIEQWYSQLQFSYTCKTCGGRHAIVLENI